ncbi:hypothetical protein DFJ67_6938 [Asanoa ferruginea]|uniref:Uncharacterized protein n=1 Tax=Asanoa ferruginea TaxID=53367 RepID=A0A3E0A3J5_9ACTN|nr:hypothetical protein [Asanoa ferruginea]REG00881.1 hypothetical protein DFJ67_6938 [Asanoa ferruginea]GIF47457.1 hypothetical protein Afe04nite_19960 [Asanoa ferruginea]
MAVITKNHALNVIRRAFGPDFAESIAGSLPSQINLDDPADTKVLADLGVTRDRLLDALGGEL